MMATSGRRFRFSSNIFGLGSRAEFAAMCRRAEDYGYDTIFAADHLGHAAPASPTTPCTSPTWTPSRRSSTGSAPWKHDGRRRPAGTDFLCSHPGYPSRQ